MGTSLPYDPVLNLAAVVILVSGVCLLITAARECRAEQKSKTARQTFELEEVK